MIEKLRSEYTLSDEDLKAIGCVAVESTYFDYALDDYIAGLTCLDEQDFRILVAGAQMKAKLDLLRALVKARLARRFEKEPELEERYARVFGDIDTQIVNRNSIIHGRWGVPKLTGNPNADFSFEWIREGDSFASKKNRGKLGHTMFEAKRIMKTARAFPGLQEQLQRLLIESGLWPPQFVRAPAPPPHRIEIRGFSPTQVARRTEPPKAHE